MNKNKIKRETDSQYGKYPDHYDFSNELKSREKIEMLETVDLLRAENRLLNKRIDQLRNQLLQNNIEPISPRKDIS